MTKRDQIIKGEIEKQQEIADIALREIEYLSMTLDSRSEERAMEVKRLMRSMHKRMGLTEEDLDDLLIER